MIDRKRRIAEKWSVLIWGCSEWLQQKAENEAQYCNLSILNWYSTKRFLNREQYKTRNTIFKWSSFRKTCLSWFKLNLGTECGDIWFEWNHCRAFITSIKSFRSGWSRCNSLKFFRVKLQAISGMIKNRTISYWQIHACNFKWDVFILWWLSTELFAWLTVPEERPVLIGISVCILFPSIVPLNNHEIKKRTSKCFRSIVRFEKQKKTQRTSLHLDYISGQYRLPNRA